MFRTNPARPKRTQLQHISPASAARSARSETQPAPPDTAATPSVPDDGIRTRLSRARLLEWLIPVSAVLLYLKFLMGSSFFSSTSYIGQFGDPKQYQWYIGWVWYALTHHLSVFVTHAFDYPHVTNLMNFTSVPLLGLLFGWLYPIIGLVATFNLIFVVNSLLICVFGKLTLRRLGVSPLFSSIGGCLFVLLPYLIAQELGHLNLYFVAFHFIFGYLLVCHLTASRPLRWQDGLLLGCLLAAIFYISLETFLSLQVFFGVLLASAAVIDRQGLWTTLTRVGRWPYILGIALGLLLVIPGVLNYFSGLPADSLVSAGAVSIIVNDLTSLVVPYKIYQLHPGDAVTLYSHITGNPSEWNGYLSLLVIVLALAGTLLNWENTRIRLFSLSALTMLLFSMGPTLHIAGPTSIPMPWGLLTHLPFIGYLLPSRFAFYAQYGVVVVLILAADRYHTRFRFSQRGMPFALNLVTLLLVVVFWFPALPYFTTTYPAAEAILAQPSVAAAYLHGKRILFLQTLAADFPHIMGLLADSGNYDVMTPNVYGNVTAAAAYPTILSMTYNPDDMHVYGGYLEAMLPSLQVDEVVYVASENTESPSPKLIAETNSILGDPIFTSQQLVIIWKVPASIKTDELTHPLDVLYTAVTASVRAAPNQPVSLPGLVRQKLLPASFTADPRVLDPNRTAWNGWVGQQTADEVTISVFVNELAARAMVEKYGQQASRVGYSPGIADAAAPPPPSTVVPGSAFAYLTLTFPLQNLLHA